MSRLQQLLLYTCLLTIGGIGAGLVMLGTASELRYLGGALSVCTISLSVLIALATREHNRVRSTVVETVARLRQLGVIPATWVDPIATEAALAACLHKIESNARIHAELAERLEQLQKDIAAYAEKRKQQHAVSTETNTPDLNLLLLTKNDRRWLFIFDDDHRQETLRTFGRYANKWQTNSEHPFGWYDAAVLSQKVRQLTGGDDDSGVNVVPQASSTPSLRDTLTEALSALEGNVHLTMLMNDGCITVDGDVGEQHTFGDIEPLRVLLRPKDPMLAATVID